MINSIDDIKNFINDKSFKRILFYVEKNLLFLLALQLCQKKLIQIKK